MKESNVGMWAMLGAGIFAVVVGFVMLQLPRPTETPPPHRSSERPPPPHPESVKPVEIQVPAPTVAVAGSVEEMAGSDTRGPAASVNRNRKARATTSPQNVQSPPVTTTKPDLQDPVARVALSLVGEDPEAEAYWIYAINNPDLPAHERQDLIEDLNEDGLSDPRNPSIDDLPLIIARLQLIEELVPEAMDQVNADAFQEAYRDLVNLYARLLQPVSP
jgi:hypothetical protein